MHHKSTNFRDRPRETRWNTYNTVPYRRRPCVRICWSLYSGWWRHLWWVERLLCHHHSQSRLPWMAPSLASFTALGQHLMRLPWRLVPELGRLWRHCFSLRRGRRRRKGSQARFPEISSCFCCQVARSVMESITYESTLITDIIVFKLMNSRWLQMLRHHMKCSLLSSSLLFT